MVFIFDFRPEKTVCPIGPAAGQSRRTVAGTQCRRHPRARHPDHRHFRRKTSVHPPWGRGHSMHSLYALTLHSAKNAGQCSRQRSTALSVACKSSTLFCASKRVRSSSAAVRADSAGARERGRKPVAAKGPQPIRSHKPKSVVKVATCFACAVDASFDAARFSDAAAERRVHGAKPKCKRPAGSTRYLWRGSSRGL